MVGTLTWEISWPLQNRVGNFTKLPLEVPTMFQSHCSLLIISLLVSFHCHLGTYTWYATTFRMFSKKVTSADCRHSHHHTHAHTCACPTETYAFWMQLYTVYFLGLITAFLCCCRGFVQLKASYQHGSFLILILLATDRNSSFDMTVSKIHFYHCHNMVIMWTIGNMVKY